MTLNLSPLPTALYCTSLPILGDLYLFPKIPALYIKILPTFVDYGKSWLGIRLDLIGGTCLGWHSQMGTGHGRPHSFSGYLSLYSLLALCCSLQFQGEYLVECLISSLKEYSFPPIPLQVSEVPSLSAFKTASGTANALTVGSARSPWWGKASWPRTRKSSAANVALDWTLTSRGRQSFLTWNPPCFCSH